MLKGALICSELAAEGDSAADNRDHGRAAKLPSVERRVARFAGGVGGPIGPFTIGRKDSEIGKLSSGASIRGWLASIANRVVIDSARRRTRKKRGGFLRLARLGDADSNSSGARDKGLSPSESAERREQATQILHALRQLPEEYRQVLALRYLAGADYDTIARQLALSNGSLRGLLARGLAMLRQNVDPEFAGPEPAHREKI